MDAAKHPAGPSSSAADAANTSLRESVELDEMSSASAAARRKTTPLQFAEYDAHAYPEVVVSGDAAADVEEAAHETATTTTKGSFWARLRGRHHAGTAGQPHDGASDEDGAKYHHQGDDNDNDNDDTQRGPVVVAPERRPPWCTWAWWAGSVPRVWRWGRAKPYLAAAAASLLVGILALIILPIVLHGMSLDGSSPSPTATATTSTTSSATSSAPTATGTAGTPPPSACTSNTTWATNVSYMGIGVAGATSWPYQLLPSTDAVECCTTCYAHFTGGCQGWSYLPWDNTPVPCTIIHGWNTTDGVSKACPNGKAPVVFATDPDKVDSVGSAGPCGTRS